jgi:hypothetical protein
MSEKTETKAEAAPAHAHAGRKAGGRKFVALHTQVGAAHGRGDLIHEDQLGDEANVQRLTKAGAVREATAEEAKLDRVTFAEMPAGGALEVQLAAKHQEVQELVAEKQELLAQLDQAKRAAGPQQAPPQAEGIDVLIKNKDQTIEELRQQNEQLRQQIADPTAVPGGGKAGHRGK